MKKITIAFLIIATFIVLSILGIWGLNSLLSDQSALNKTCEYDSECKIPFSYTIKALKYVPRCVEGKCTAVSYVYGGCTNNSDCNCTRFFEIAGDIDVNTQCNCLENWCVVIN